MCICLFIHVGAQVIASCSYWFGKISPSDHLQFHESTSTTLFQLQYIKTHNIRIAIDLVTRPVSRHV